MGELRTDKRLVLNKSETVIIYVRTHAKKQSTGIIKVKNTEMLKELPILYQMVSI